MKKFIVTTGILLSGLVLAACGGQTANKTADNAEDKIQAVATFYPMYEFTKEVLGNEGEVELLIPAGTEPHDYEPSTKDMAKISDASVLVYNSDELETWVDKVEDNLSDKTLVIEAADQIELMTTAEEDEHDHEEDHEHSEDEHESDGEEHDHDHGGVDPHVWTDPALAIKEVEEIEAQLAKKYPAKKAVFEKNADAYIAQLQKLDEEFKAAFKDAKNKTFVTQHAAFGYLAKQYGLTQESISGISPDQEPSPSRLAELKHYVDENHVEVIYFEENANSKVAETLSKETGVKLAVLNPLESLTKKQMAEGETYLSVMQANLTALKESIH